MYLGTCKRRGQLDFLQDAPMRVFAIPTVANSLTIRSSIFPRPWQPVGADSVGNESCSTRVADEREKRLDSCTRRQIRTPLPNPTPPASGRAPTQISPAAPRTARQTQIATTSYAPPPTAAPTWR